MTQDSQKHRRILSGIQATGIPHIGNYIGAIKHWVEEQQTNAEAYYMIADLHAITVPFEPNALRNNRLGALAGLLACGLDVKRVNLFLQSEITQHSELCWLLSSVARIGELGRMTQFKVKSGEVRDSTSLALFSYPVLQAADILLYKATHVPVGEDQKQHIELARDIASRFNEQFGAVFVVPEPVIPTLGARVMDLQDPSKKMSKSGTVSALGTIFLNDSDEDILKKIKRAVTDSDGTVAFTDSKPGLANLLTIYAALGGIKIEDAVTELSNKRYGEVKQAVAERIIHVVAPIRAKLNELLSNPEALARIADEAIERVRQTASESLNEVRIAMGLESFGSR